MRARKRVWRAAAVAGAVVAGALGATTGIAGAATAPHAAFAPTTNPLKLISTDQLDPRLVQLTMSTPSIMGDVHVRVLLPADYAESTTRYPVLYLLHGSGSDAAQWTTDGFNAETLTAKLPVIVVMPDGGANGEYTNWVAPPSGQGPQQWETFDIAQLVPWIDAHYRTIANRNGRALSGESMGGLGTMEYAARYPDLFGTAASLSGAVALLSSAGAAGVVANEYLFGSAGLSAIYGPLTSDQVNYRGHNPPDLAMNLANTQLWASAYDGLPTGPYGTGLDGGGAGNVLEYGVHEDSLELVAALTKIGIPISWHDLGAGVHETPEFAEEFSLALPWIMNAFAHPTAAPSSVSYTSIAPTWNMWGWTVAVNRAAQEFSTLRNASVRGFDLLGSGNATVTTPATYTPGTRYTVTVTPSQAGEPGDSGEELLGCGNETDAPQLDQLCISDAVSPPDTTSAPWADGTPTSTVLTASRAKRLTLSVPLGPSNATQEYSTTSSNSATLIYRTAITITALPSPKLHHKRHHKLKRKHTKKR